MLLGRLLREAQRPPFNLRLQLVPKSIARAIRRDCSLMEQLIEKFVSVNREDII